MALQSNQRQALASLIAGETIEQAASAAGVQESTVYKWKSENFNGFLTALNEANERILSDVVMSLTVASREAVGVLREVMLSDDTQPQTRVSAARALLVSIIKVKELYDIEQRISELENRLAS